MAFRLLTFGDARLTEETGRTVAFPEKAVLALAYLVSRPVSELPRIAIANLLWGENDNVNALVNLRQLLSRVKARQEELGAAFFEISHDAIGIKRNNLSADFLELSPPPETGPVQLLQNLLRNVTGEFFSGFDAASERSRFWLEAERSRYASRFASTLEAVASTDLKSNGQLVKDSAFRLLELDPYNDVAYSALLKVFAQDGHLSQAKILFERYKKRLWSDLRTAPNQQLLAQMRALFDAGCTNVITFKSERAELADAKAIGVQLPRLLLMPPSVTRHGAMAANLVTALIEDVTIGLCRAKTITTVAPFTAERIASDRAGLAQAFQRHAVSYVLETRLRSTDGFPSLFTALIRLERDETIWAERFDLSPDALPLSYNQIIRRIVTTVAGQIQQHEMARISTRPDAYQHYLIGQHHLKTIDLPDIRRARRSFRSALRNAPGFAGALSGLARTEHIEWLLTARGDKTLLQSAETHALKAILADADDASGYHQLAVTKLYQGAFDESIDAFEGAEQSAPSHADLIADYADTLVHASQPVRALEKIERAIEFNPLCPDLYWWTAAGANYCLENFHDAQDHADLSRF